MASSKLLLLLVSLCRCVSCTGGAVRCAVRCGSCVFARPAKHGLTSSVPSLPLCLFASLPLARPWHHGGLDMQAMCVATDVCGNGCVWTYHEPMCVWTYDGTCVCAHTINPLAHLAVGRATQAQCHAGPSGGSRRSCLSRPCPRAPVSATSALLGALPRPRLHYRLLTLCPAPTDPAAQSWPQGQ